MSLVSTLRRLRSGLSFGAGADGSINLDRAGWLSDSRRPGEPLPETDGQAGRGFSYGLSLRRYKLG